MPMRHKPINPELFIRNRKRLIANLPASTHVLVKSGTLIPRSADTHYPFRPNSDFFWATGVEEPEAVVVITSSGDEVLFLPQTTEFEKLWNGPRLEETEAVTISGIHDIHPLAKLRAYKKTLPGREIQAQDYIRQLRAIKDSVEIELLQAAADITRIGFESALNELKPGVMEYEIEAQLTQDFTNAQASGHAYEPIIASGPNACVLHYIKNNNACNAGELLLVDAGAEYANYASDVTRTWPVSGAFTARQKDMYEAVLRVQKAAIKGLGPGVKLKDSEHEVGIHMMEELTGLGLLGKKQTDPSSYRQFFPHSTSHFLGLDVHDVGDYERPLDEGMVITVEPGIYIRQEGLGIRLEDDIVITKTGALNLTASIPIEADEIEERMASKH